MSEIIEDGTGIGNTVTWVMTGPDGKVKSTGTAEIEVTPVENSVTETYAVEASEPDTSPEPKP